MDVPAVTGQTVLVTGGAGFIGSHIVDALVANNTVRVLDDFSTGRRANCNEDAVVIEGDVWDSETLSRATADVDLVFHEAALVSVEQSIAEPRRNNAVTLDATVDLLERAREESARVVVASSAAIYGTPDTVPVGEAASKTPESPYGIAKLAVDQYARAYHELYGLETVVLRYFNVYGPRQPAGDYSGVISVFLRQAANDDRLPRRGVQYRDGRRNERSRPRAPGSGRDWNDRRDCAY
jgi:UDP-glucose 4-epimerase